MQQESFREISGMGEWAPPFGTLSSATPFNTLARNKAWGGCESDVNENHSHLGWLEGADKNGPEGERSQSNS